MVTSIQISQSPKIIQNTRVEIKNDIPFVRNYHVTKYNEDGSVEYLENKTTPFGKRHN